jgi:hypothetical protein
MKHLRTAFVILLLQVLCLAQSTEKKFGGTFDTLKPEQQKLVKGWAAEYNRVTGRNLTAPGSYDKLPVSVRTTFDAVTHALLQSKLTDENGASLGTALDIIKLVEGVHGEVPNARGDHQFRIYVLLKPDALDRLYKSNEFKRTHDNTVYHIGYPINFRQQGGTPSIQVSVTRTGRRADIDVDYRTSSGPKALMNGHLTSANSDVRAGNNYQVHSQRWQDFNNWWASLLGIFKPPANETMSVLDVTTTLNPKVKDSAPVQEAVLDFMNTWLVDGKPEVAMSYISVKSYACLAEFQNGEQIDSGLAALRILEHLRQALAAYGKSPSLDVAIQSAPLYTQGAKPVVHPYGKLFALEHLPDDAAQSMDCRTKLHLNLAEPLPKVGHAFGDNYASMARLRLEKGPPVVLTQLWRKEEGFWKVISWHLEQPLRVAETPRLAKPEAIALDHSVGPPADPRLIAANEEFLKAWLVTRQYEHAATYFAPEALACSEFEGASTPLPLLTAIGDKLPRRAQLKDLITTVEFGHPQMQAVPHPDSQAFLLARVSDDLAKMSLCNAPPPGREAAAGHATYATNTFQTIFRLKDAPGVGAALTLQWNLRADRWRIVAVDIVYH